MVDPEALLLFSSVFARHDARLFDEIADWLKQNGNWMNLLRMARLQRDLELGDATVLGALAEHLKGSSSHAKWKVFAGKAPHVGPPTPLFPHLPIPKQTDEIFRRWGWQRAPLEWRGLSKPPRPTHPAAFLLRLRALFGLQSRAEILAWLLAHESGHPAQIARATGYFRGSVQNVLNELEVSGLVVSIRAGREKRFSAPRDHWRFLISWSPDDAAEFPQWVPWAPLFTLIRGFHDLMSSAAFAKSSEDHQSIELKRVFTPLLARISKEEYPTQSLAKALAQHPTGTLLKEFQKLLDKFNEAP